MRAVGVEAEAGAERPTPRSEALFNPQLSPSTRARCVRRGSLGSSLAAATAAAAAAGALSGNNVPKGMPALRLAVHQLLEENAASKSDDEGKRAATGNHAATASRLERVGPPPPPPLHRRKFSFPAALHSNLLGLSAAGGGVGGGSFGGVGGEGAGAAARRRFSNVSDAVSRKLSHTLGGALLAAGGWRGAGGLGAGSAAAALLAEQARALCTLYVRLRLRRDGLFSRKCGLRRGGSQDVKEVFPVLAAVGGEMERQHARTFMGVARQTGAAPGGSLPSDKAAACALAAVARDLFKQEITWAKVVALFCVAGGLAADCARQGRPDYVTCLPDAIAEAVEEDLAPWIHSNGGWQGLSTHFRPVVGEVEVGRYVFGILGALVLSVFLLALLLRYFGIPSTL